MMLLIARAATARLSIGLVGLYGWCRFRDQATSPPCVGVIGSSPIRPVLASAKFGSSPLIISAKTQSICRVALPHANLTFAGSDITSGFWQARPGSFCTVATLGVPDPPPADRVRA